MGRRDTHKLKKKQPQTPFPNVAKNGERTKTKATGAPTTKRRKKAKETKNANRNI